MRLSKIKLAGFKSFVDPTVLHLPSHLVGIVGPNGCGKSNIIDAVRWVMGESSARSLRGESMTDVIFNGSASRKPVGQASIELVFDNSAGRLGGPWSSYAEIAVKRLVGRDSQSSYFLNGSRCRRRDIADLFLGTGLGPRSYAIIEQGMISRVIEARPEDLRLFLEEAAGISRYKERRRETEARIRHTRENLDRLNDVREELNRQLQHLQRQARAAEQYRDYRTEERQLRAELLTLRWRDLQTEILEFTQTLRQQETALEAMLAEQRRLEALLETGRARRLELNEAFNIAQERYYQAGGEISRLEQYLQHQRELQRRREEDWRQTITALEQIERQWVLDREQCDELTATLAEAEPALTRTLLGETEAEAALAAAEMALHESQTDWENFSQRNSEAQRQAEVERTRIEHLDRQLLQGERRLERLRFEQAQLAEADLEQTLVALHETAQALAEDLHAAQEYLTQLVTELDTTRITRQHVEQQAQMTQEGLQTGRGRLASLHTLQEAALGRQESSLNDWLRHQGLNDAPRLAEQLDVESGWEAAVEMALAGWLDALCVSPLDHPALAAKTALPQGRLTLFEPPALPSNAFPQEEQALDNTLFSPEEDRNEEKKRWPLTARIQAPWPLTSLLDHVRTVPSVTEALADRPHLQPGEILVTPDGVLCGRHWLRLARGGAEDGVLAREREIRQLEISLDGAASKFKQQTEQLDQLRDRQRELEQQHHAAQQAVNQKHRDQVHAQSEVKTIQARWEQACTRREALAEEQAELDDQYQQDREQVQLARMQLEDALLTLENLRAEQTELSNRREQAQEQYQHCRTQTEATRQETAHQAAMLETLRVQVAAADRALVRLDLQQRQVQERRDRLKMERVADSDELLATAGDELAGWLETRLAIEAESTEARQRLETQDAESAAHEQARRRCERQVETQRRQLEEQRLASSEARVRQQSLREQLAEWETIPETVVSTLPSAAVESDWLTRLEQIERRIQRLGAINLAAIEELAELSERKQYLDAQDADLLEALATLENAIRQMDRETRTRFRDTFEQVNTDLQMLFPRLFGGGEAHLELTGEDVLNAGVAIMAKPPGKRIGSISLLSGGEKALTAVALVFAIFQLNPAPFCLLDEVDAPLDEANVRRFGALVQDMATRVQFVFITHNKATMEIADHLAGVTMQEPGVSRLVAVDVEAAARLAGVG
ncbi:MAG: chromosome segregation protein SMC [Gammaproteobacteria bacterium]|nr:chromosome segregation protein SMC [Gammaproteobacteria bacterium]MCP5196560.1 chromosome segregation protein SMC [Gammaproteobacteria bacterium]